MKVKKINDISNYVMRVYARQLLQLLFWIIVFWKKIQLFGSMGYLSVENNLIRPWITKKKKGKAKLLKNIWCQKYLELTEILCSGHESGRSGIVQMYLETHRYISLKYLVLEKENRTTLFCAWKWELCRFFDVSLFLGSGPHARHASGNLNTVLLLQQ